MKQRYTRQLVFIALAMAGGAACSWPLHPVAETTIKIGARHLVHSGREKWPEEFKILATISKKACDPTEGSELLVQAVFSGIAETILEDLKDPLLKADLEDLIDLMGVSLSPDFELDEVSPELQGVLEVVVCEFGKGVK